VKLSKGEEQFYIKQAKAAARKHGTNFLYKTNAF